MNTKLSKIFKSFDEVNLEKHEVELGLVDDLKINISIVRKAEELAKDLIKKKKEILEEIKKYSVEFNRVQKNLADIGSTVEVKSKELGIPLPKEVVEADKLLDQTFKLLSELK